MESSESGMGNGESTLNLWQMSTDPGPRGAAAV